MSKTQHCCICGSQTLKQLIGFSDQVVCHHFLKNSNESASRHRLTLGQCETCATVQLTERIAQQELAAKYDWLKCNEPEVHLDQLVEQLVKLPGMNKDSAIGGISFKDDTTLDRFKKRGFEKVWRADVRQDLGATEPIVAFHSVQEHFNQQTAQRLIERYGQVDILCVRHIIEHAYDFKGFIDACKMLVKPEGYIYFEIPDCEKALAQLDYTTVWEEHTVYFTEKTFKHFFGYCGLSLASFKRIPYSSEDSYIAIAKVSSAAKATPLSASDLKSEMAQAAKFAAGFEGKKSAVKDFLNEYKQKRKKVALFGAGHMSCVFINFFDLQNDIDFVVDDDPNMRGLLMPGSGVPIVESKMIYEQNVDLCLLTLSPASEEKVIRNHQRYLEKGGQFVSVFPGSKWAMKLTDSTTVK